MITPAPRATDLPAGTLTLLFSDVAGSTRGWEEHGEAFGASLTRHFEIVFQAIESHGGAVFKTVGDEVCAVFASPDAAVQAAVEAQRGLRSEPWPAVPGPIHARMAVHRGVPVLRGDDYFGPPVNRVARLLSAAHPDQILLSAAVVDALEEGGRPFSTRPLGVHLLKDLQNPEALFQVVAPGLPGDFPSPLTLDARPHNLPVQVTSFVGRGEEIRHLAEMLEHPDARLVTLLGPPGVGKTRLATQFAAEWAYRFPDGVWLVELAGIRDPSAVAQQILTALGIREESGRPSEERLTTALAQRRMLLICDNFEHVLPAAATIRRLLDATKNVQVLVTSRSLLRITGELPFEVRPLEAPRSEGSDSARDLLDCPATALFLDRARTARPGWEPADPEADLIARLCADLDGLPLAIELAAARMRSMSLSDIRARLSDRFRLLAAGRSDLPERQRTLRAALDWSFDLLTPEEQVSLAHLGVFHGGFTLEAAEAVCDRGDTWDILPALQDQSFLFARERDGVMRYDMLEVVREYALQHLGDEEERKREAHALYFLPLAEDAVDATGTAGEEAAFSALDRETDNLRAAVSWSCQARKTDLCARLTVAMSEYLRCRGLWPERLQRLDDALSQARPVLDGAPVVGWLCFHEAFALRDLGRLDEAEIAADEALRRARDQRDGRLEARVLNLLGMVAVQRRDSQTAEDWYHEALTAARAADDPFSTASALVNLGRLAVERQDWVRARGLYEESIPLWREVESTRGLATTLNGLGIVHYEAARAGDLSRADEAIRFYGEALEIQRQLQNIPSVALLLNNIAEVLEVRGDRARALPLFAVSERVLRTAGSPSADYVAAGRDRVAAALPSDEVEVLVRDAGRDPLDVASEVTAWATKSTGQDEGAER